MKVLLIYPDFPEWDVGGCYYTGVASLSAVLKQAGHEVIFWHISSDVSKHDFLNKIEFLNPGLVGISSTTPMFKYTRQYVAWIKEKVDTLVICGGMHARMHPEEVIMTDGIDIVCYGEGEESIVQLCDKLQMNLDYSKISNFMVNTKAGVIRNPLKLIDNLNDLPDPDRDIFDHQNLYDYKKQGAAKTAAFIFSRGCPFKCSYCGNPSLLRSYINIGNYVRRISPERAVNQIERHLDKYPETEYIRIHDSIINLDRKWFFQFCHLYKEKVKIPYICLLRVDKNLFDETVVTQLRDSGCLLVMMGIEHGNHKYRKKILNRNISDQEIISAFQLCKKHSLATRAYAMFGTPFETFDLMLDTIKLAAKSEVFDLSATIFYPFPGTELHELCLREGFVLDDNFSVAWPTSILVQPSVSKEATYLVWRLSRLLLFMYANLYKQKMDEASQIETEMDIKEFIASIIREGINKDQIEIFKLLDEFAHKQYKSTFHTLTQQQRDLLLRI